VICPCKMHFLPTVLGDITKERDGGSCVKGQRRIEKEPWAAAAALFKHKKQTQHHLHGTLQVCLAGKGRNCVTLLQNQSCTTAISCISAKQTTTLHQLATPCRLRGQVFQSMPPAPLHCLEERLQRRQPTTEAAPETLPLQRVLGTMSYDPKASSTDRCTLSNMVLIPAAKRFTKA